MTRAEQQARIDAIRWYHEFDFPDGLHARSPAAEVASHRRIWHFIETQLAAIDFAGKTVLDVGCWDGYWSFYAERRGARAVLATDDVTQNWSDGSGLLLAKELLNSRVETRQDVSIYNLTSLERQFDIVMCLGVYYHLIDPFHAFAQLRHCCHADSLLVLEGNLTRSQPEHPHIVYRFGDGSSLNLLSAPALDGLLSYAFFGVRSRTWLHTEAEPIGWRTRVLQKIDRFLAANRSWVPLQFLNSIRVIDRALTVCVPVEGVNSHYHYEPPFGLARYDERFRGRTLPP
jgi:tRNA (mo5U34)-methyltransferase